jgi:hypothetical protein
VRSSRESRARALETSVSSVGAAGRIENFGRTTQAEYRIDLRRKTILVHLGFRSRGCGGGQNDYRAVYRPHSGETPQSPDKILIERCVALEDERPIKRLEASRKPHTWNEIDKRYPFFPRFKGHLPPLPCSCTKTVILPEKAGNDETTGMIRNTRSYDF